MHCSTADFSAYRGAVLSFILKNRQIIDRLLMTMLAKYNWKINSPDIWLKPLILVISFTLANMNLENIEEASVNGLIQ